MSPSRHHALAVQVYSLWSSASSGIGDLGDVAELARRTDADLLLLSPLHATRPGQPSPYFPSSRQFRDPIYLRVAGASPFAPGSRIDRDAAWQAKAVALERQWEHFSGDTRFDAFRAAMGSELSSFATFCVLTEKFGAPWREWPADVRRPDGREVAAFAIAHADRVRYFEWLQWQLDEQVAAIAKTGTGLVNDVAVGVDPDGADAWMWQDALADGVHLGAPPDAFNADGQDWGIRPFAPAALAANGSRPFAAALDTAFAHAAGVRIDHVMGLFRQYWIPDGASPAEGAYVPYPSTALLDLVTATAHRHDAFVIGEDLGTVQDSVRAELRQRGVLSYKVLWFEEEPPERWPAQSMASVTTHDLPTIAGVWTGHDGSPEMRSRLRGIVGNDDASVNEVVARVHAAIDRAPSVVVCRTLEDVLGVVERPNRPGTLDPDNWSRPLPVPVEQLG